MFLSWLASRHHTSARRLRAAAPAGEGWWA